MTSGGRDTKTIGRLFGVVWIVTFAGLCLGACADEESVFIDKRAFDEPIETVNRFLGYVGDPTEKITSCTNCHAAIQASWETTFHAEAWASLLGSGHAQDFCEGCHAISERGASYLEQGQTKEASLGYNRVKDLRYVDVQCESCHGSGWEHVNVPATVQPLASIAADSGLVLGCGECHEGLHQPFVRQWRDSRHANLIPQLLSRSDCTPCHEGRAALERIFFETADYVEKRGEEAMPIVCAVCHDPHGTDLNADLRAPIDAASRDNLCLRCHAWRGTPPSMGSPHAAQGLLLLADEVGWIPAQFSFPQVSVHGGPTNRKLCVTCHVQVHTVLDNATGGFHLQSVGHGFKAVPCVDPNTGEPATGECDVSERDFAACTLCHSGEDLARSLYVSTWAELNSLLDSLWFDTDGDGVMDAADAGLLPRVVAMGESAEFDPRDDIIAVAEGALFNAQIAYTSDRTFWGDLEVFGIHLSADRASGNGVHNPALLEELLKASIDAVMSEYFSP